MTETLGPATSGRRLRGRRGLVAPGRAQVVQRRVDLLERRRWLGRLDLARFDLGLPVAEPGLHAAVVVAPVVEHALLPRHAEELADALRLGARVGGDVLVADDDARVVRLRELERVAV